MEENTLLTKNSPDHKDKSLCCAPPEDSDSQNFVPLASLFLNHKGKNRQFPRWAEGTVMTEAGPVLRVSGTMSFADVWEHVRCRVSTFRNTYTVQPGLYALGNPDKTSHVFVTANYKYSFDELRTGLQGQNAWILALDTKGINVWCAAGKGTFGTAELVRRIALVNLAAVVSHKRVILPQLGAPGVSAHQVVKDSGFRVIYGPVYAHAIPEYIRNGCKATTEMRKIGFSMKDRVILTPMEINPAIKWFPLFAIITLLLFGLQPSGILFRAAFRDGTPFLLLGLGSVFSGAFMTPVLLPFIPFRSFAVKGWVMGTAMLLTLLNLPGLTSAFNPMMKVLAFVFFPAASSFIALQFTGSTTFTGMSGVKKELRIAIPLYITALVISSTLLICIKLNQWGIL